MSKQEFVAVCYSVLGIAPTKYQLDYMEKRGLFDKPQPSKGQRLR